MSDLSAAAGTVSADGKWVWSGTDWVPHQSQLAAARAAPVERVRVTPTIGSGQVILSPATRSGRDSAPRSGGRLIGNVITLTLIVAAGSVLVGSILGSLLWYVIYVDAAAMRAALAVGDFTFLADLEQAVGRLFWLAGLVTVVTYMGSTVALFQLGTIHQAVAGGLVTALSGSIACALIVSLNNTVGGALGIGALFLCAAALVAINLAWVITKGRAA